MGAVSGVRETNEWNYILPTAAQSGQSYGNLLDIQSKETEGSNVRISYQEVSIKDLKVEITHSHLLRTTNRAGCYLVLWMPLTLIP